jgi:HEAT repeat protein
LRRLVQIHEERPDAFATMLVLAGRCLAEVDAGKVEHSLAQQIAEGVSTAWKGQGCPQDLVPALAHEGGVQWLMPALRDRDAHVRASAALALGELADASAVLPLIQALRDEEANVRWPVADALGELGDGAAVQPLIQALRDESAFVGRVHKGQMVFLVRCSVAHALGELGDAAAVPALVEALRHEDVVLRAVAATALGQVGDVAAVQPLLLALRDDDWKVRRNAATALRVLGYSGAVRPLVLALSEGTDVLDALHQLGDDIQGEWIDDVYNWEVDLGRMLDDIFDEDDEWADEVPETDAGVRSPVQALRDENAKVRASAAYALGKLGDPTAIQLLLLALRDEEVTVREAAAWSLKFLRRRHPCWFPPSP